MSNILDELVHRPGHTPPGRAPSTPAPAPAPATAEPARAFGQVAAPKVEALVSTPPRHVSPAFEAKRSLAERLNLRVLLFLGIVLLPIAGLAYVYFESATSDGIRQGADGYLHVDLQKMSSFAFDQVNGRLEDVPQRWRELDGKRVVLEGEMAPVKTAAGEVDQFDLVWSVANCCYSGAPQVQHFVRSTVADNGRVKYYNRPVRVRGRLDVNVTKAGGAVTGVYHLSVENVEPIG